MEHLEIVTPPVVTQTGTTTMGSPVVTGLSTAALAGAVGVSGIGIPFSTYVLSVDSSSQVTLTQNATASGSVSLTFNLEPITLPEAKAQLLVDISNDDAFIAGIITAARMRAEVLLRQTILLTTYDWFFDYFPAAANGYYNRLVRQMGPNPQWLPNGAAILQVPKPPLVSVDSVKYYDSSGNQETYPSNQYFVSTGMGSRIQPIIGFVWPVTRPQIDAVVVRYTSGLANASLVPDNVKIAVKMLVNHWYENRDTTVTGTIVTPIPDAVDALLSATDHGNYA